MNSPSPLRAAGWISMPVTARARGELPRRHRRCAPGDSGGPAPPPSAAPGRGDGVLVRDRHDLVEQMTVEHGRDDPGADALDAMRTGLAPRQDGRAAGLDGDDS